MEGIINNFHDIVDGNFNITNCSHLRLERATEFSTVENVYSCEQCKQQCQVTFTSKFSFDSSSLSHSVEFEVSSKSSYADTENEESISIEPDQTLSTSRLKDEFICLHEILGQGGFGSVGKFKNKKDEKIYAIKKIEATERNEREVKVLSDLQHDNIVRYYNCWTESNDSGFPKNIQEGGSSENIEEEEVPNGGVLYIQMEFCEKRTLRESIDSGDLVRDKFRVRKLFRQMVEGISYFHSKGVIHRDLKPENVFLNSDDCVKIGDFGLATDALRPQLANNGANDMISKSLTKQCGTHFYMAPELVHNGKYNAKVDMYSLGIIVFEMCHEPFKTGMERFAELEKIRLPNFSIPLKRLLSFSKATASVDISANRTVLPTSQERQELKKEKQEERIQTKNMIEIIKQLLVHDPKKRPSAEELLKSSNMPPPLLENVSKFFQLVDFLLFSRKGALKYSEYHKLMQRCLDQTTSERDVFQWICDLTTKANRKNWQSRNDTFTLSLSPTIHNFFIKRCQETGAKYLQPASLFPKLVVGENYKSEELKQLASVLARKTKKSTEFINSRGTSVVLATDSHTPFARHIATYNINDFKRYCVNHVYNDGLKYTGPPPEPSTELVFDIVTPKSAKSSTLRQADAQVVQVISRVLKDCKMSSIKIQMSHHLLLEAILVYCKVPVNQRSKVCAQFDANSGIISLAPNGLSDGSLINHTQLFKIGRLLHVRGSLSDVKSLLNELPDWVGSEAALLANQAFNELKEIINLSRGNKKQQGLAYPVWVDVSIGLESYATHSGFMFRFMHQPYHDEIELASGGRYDALVASFRKAIVSLDKQFNNGNNFPQSESKDCEQHVVGGSIYMNRLASKMGK